jgi:CTP synthase (UTP-ammonia lyase)
MKKQFSTNVKSTSLQNTLLEIISLCQKNEIELIGIKFPLSNSYIELLDSMSYGADQLFISKDLKVIDLKEVFVDNPEYFANQDHINSKGSKIFTEILFEK